MYKNIKQLLNDLVEVSKYTKTTNKKKSIILLGIIGNLLVLSDILIILSFASVFDQKIETWINCHINAFRDFGGVPKVIKLDNLKAGCPSGKPA